MITHQSPAARWQTGFNLALLVAWLWLYAPLRPWLATIFSREDFRTNQLLLIGILLLIGRQLWQAGSRPRPDAAPHLARLPLALALGSSLLYLLAERFLNVNTLSGTLFGLASYGLLGLWLAPARWRQGLPAALLLIGTLPFGDHLQTFVGYPLRLFTAALVRDGLNATGIATLGVDTILIFENGVSQVDLPCSGVKSLWTGALFLLAATWIERRPLDRRWVGVALLLAFLLIAANLVRVALLVLMGEVAGWRMAAAMWHVPLGVPGFGAACVAAVWLLRRMAPFSAETAPAPPPAPRPAWLTPALTAAVVLMALAWTPRPQSGLAAAAPDWQLPADLALEPLPLKPDEEAWLTRDGADFAGRYRFARDGVQGSVILISSQTWRAHHRPERCFEVYGLTLEESSTLLLAPGFPLRQVHLGHGNEPARHTAAYWFQSADQTTDDYATRIWADLSPQRQRWMLVSILLDDQSELTRPATQALFLALHSAVADHLR